MRADGVGQIHAAGRTQVTEASEQLGGKLPLPERPTAPIASRDRMIPARPKEQGAFSWCQHRALNATPFDPASQAQPGHQRCYVRRYARVQRRGVSAPGRLRGPAAADRPVEPHDREKLVALELDQLQLGVEELALGVQDFEVARDAAAIADPGLPRSITQRVDERFLLDASFPPLPVLDESIRDVAECLLD